MPKIIIKKCSACLLGILLFFGSQNAQACEEFYLDHFFSILYPEKTFLTKEDYNKGFEGQSDETINQYFSKDDIDADEKVTQEERNKRSQEWYAACNAIHE